MLQSARIFLLALALFGGLAGPALADRPSRDREYSEEGRHRHRNDPRGEPRGDGERNRGGERGRNFGEERQRERRPSISADQAVRMAEQRFRGAKVVRIQTRQEGDHTVYHLRLMSSDGTIRNIRIDAASGAQL